MTKFDNGMVTLYSNFFMYAAIDLSIKRLFRCCIWLNWATVWLFVFLGIQSVISGLFCVLLQCRPSSSIFVYACILEGLAQQFFLELFLPTILTIVTIQTTPFKSGIHFIYLFIAQRLKVCRTLCPTACSKKLNEKHEKTMGEGEKIHDCTIIILVVDMRYQLTIDYLQYISIWNLVHL